MKNMGFVLAALLLTIAAAAKEKEMQGTVISENSVPCGSQDKGKKKTDMMCQEYVIRAGTTDYHVRQEKEAHKELIPVNSPAELSINKDKMKFKVNGKSYEMLIVSEAAAPPEKTPASTATTPAAPAKP